MKNRLPLIFWIITLALTITVFALSFIPNAAVLWFAAPNGEGAIVSHPSFYSFWDSRMLGYAQFYPPFSVVFLVLGEVFGTLGYFLVRKTKGFGLAAACLHIVSLALMLLEFTRGIRYFTPIVITVLCLEVVVVGFDLAGLVFVFGKKRASLLRAGA